MKKYIALFLFTLSVLYSDLKTQVLEMQTVRQEQSNWCWAACTEAVLESSYWSNNISQCGIVNFSRTRQTPRCTDFGTQSCCNSPLPTLCNSPNFFSGCNGSVNDILQNFNTQTSIRNVGSTSSLSIATITGEISNYRPFIFGWAWNGGGGHALVGFGITRSNNTDYLTYLDPGNGIYYSSYSFVISGTDFRGTHTWNQTLRLLTSPTNVPSITSPANNSNNVSLTSTLNWSDIANSTYDLKVSSNQDFSSIVVNQTNLTSSQYVIPSNVLNPNTVYYWKVRAKNTSGKYSSYCNVFSFVTAPCNTPTGLGSSNFTSTSARINWSTIIGISSYTLEYKLSNTSTWTEITGIPQSSNYRDLTGLTPGTAYKFKMKTVCNSSSQSNYSSEYAFSTTCIAPSGLSITNLTSNSARINWSAISGVSGYTLEYKTSSASTWTIVSSIPQSYTYKDLTGLSSGVTYNVRMKTNCSSSSTSSYTAVSNFTPTCNAPSGLSITNLTSNSARINWSAISGVSGYTLEYKTSSASTWTIVSSIPQSYTYKDLTGLSAGTTYNVRMKTNCSSSSASSYTSVTNFTPTCTVISGLNITNLTSNSARINWSAISGVSGYTLEYKTSSASTWTIVNSIPQSYTYKDLTGLSSGVTYNVRMKTNCSSASTSSYTAVTNFTPSCIAPSGLSITNLTSNSARINWSAISGVSGYTLEYKTSSASTWTIVSSIPQSYTYKDLTGLSSGVTYNVRMKTNCSSSSTSNYTSVTNFTPTCTVPSGLSVTNLTSNSARINWSAISGVSGYTLEYKTSSASTWTIVSSIPQSYTYKDLTGLSSGVTYNVRMKTNCSSSSESSYTSTYSFTPTCTSPSGLNISNVADNLVRINWSTITGVNGYTLEYKTSSASTWTIVSSIPQSYTYKDLTGLSSGVTYNVRMKTNCSSSSVSDYTSVYNFTTSCTSPSGLSSSNVTSTGARINWSTISGISSYTLEYRLSNSSSWTVVSSISQSYYYKDITGLTPGSTYFFRMKTICNSSSQSNYTSEYSFSTLCPTPASNSVSNLTVSSARINWTLTNYINNYTLEYKLSNASSWSSISVPGNYYYYVISGLTRNRAYDYRIKTNCTSGTQSNYATGSFTTPNAKESFGDEDITNNDVSIYPNPASNEVTINGQNIKSMALYTALGTNIMQLGNVSTLDVNLLTTGIYMLKIIFEDNSIATKKLIINK